MGVESPRRDVFIGITCIIIGCSGITPPAGVIPPRDSLFSEPHYEPKFYVIHNKKLCTCVGSPECKNYGKKIQNADSDGK